MKPIQANTEEPFKREILVQSERSTETTTNTGREASRFPNFPSTTPSYYRLPTTKAPVHHSKQTISSADKPAEGLSHFTDKSLEYPNPNLHLEEIKEARQTPRSPNPGQFSKYNSSDEININQIATNKSRRYFRKIARPFEIYILKWTNSVIS